MGVLALRFRDSRAFGDDERAFLLALAGQGGQALERARLYDAERTARAEAEAAVHARDEFLSIASHELRNPVASLKLVAQTQQRWLARGQLDPERIATYLHVTSLSANRLSVLLDDLLDVSRLRTGQLQLRRQEIELATLVNDVVTRLRQEHLERRIELQGTENACWVHLDPDRMDQVLINLIGNALKYSPETGSVIVSLATDSSGALLRVQDEGIGLPEGTADVTFQPFGRAQNARSRNVPGMGLGLYISRQIVQSHGGRIWAESPGVNCGTTLSVWLPRDAETPADG